MSLPPGPDEVRAACAEVAGRARSVQVVHAALDALADAYATAPAPEVDDPAHVALPSAADTIAFVLTLDAINFGSGWFPELRPHQGRSGYALVAHALREAWAAEGVRTADELAVFTAEQAADLLGQVPEGPVAGFLELIAVALRGLGAWLLEHHGGSFVHLLAGARGSAVELVRTLGTIPGWRDVPTHDGHDVPILKRAQIAALDLHLALGGRGPGALRDLDRLTIFADDLVPHVLRVDGALAYDDALAARVAGGEVLRAGSSEEVEIRACAVHAAEELVARLRARDPAWTAWRLDQLLWRRGQDARYAATPRHRCRSRAY